MNWHPTFKCFVDSGLTQNSNVTLVDLNRAYQKYADALKSVDTDTIEGAQQMDMLVETYNKIFEKIAPYDRKGELKLKSKFVKGLKERSERKKTNEKSANKLEIQPHPKEVADLDDEQVKKVKDRFKEQPKKYDLDKMAKKIADLEQNLKAVKLKGTPEQYRKLQDELEKLRRQYQSVYKNEPKKTNGFAEKVGSYKGYDLAVTFDGDNSESAVLLKSITGDKTKSPHWVAYALDKNKGTIGLDGRGKTKQDAIDKIKSSIDRFEKVQKDNKSYWDKRLKDTKPKTEPKLGYEWQFGDDGWKEIKK